MLFAQEEKYIAIAYAGDFPDSGAVVIWDILKRKAKRLYRTASVNWLAWSHTGEFLFIGTAQSFYVYHRYNSDVSLLS